MIQALKAAGEAKPLTVQRRRLNWSCRERSCCGVVTGSYFIEHDRLKSVLAGTEQLTLPWRADWLILLVPGERIELPTNGLQNRCSTAELTRRTLAYT